MKNPSLYPLPLKTIEVSSDLATWACILGNRVEGFDVVEGVPRESTIVEAKYEHNVLYLVVTHESFPLVESGAEIPTMTVTATKIGETKPLSTVEQKAVAFRDSCRKYDEVLDGELKLFGVKVAAASEAKEIAEERLLAAVDALVPPPVADSTTAPSENRAPATDAPL